jgi:thioredoxin 1
MDELGGERPSTGADLDHRVARGDPQRVDDPRDRASVDQEMLAQGRAPGAPAPACYTCAALSPCALRVARSARGRDGGNGGSSVAVASDRILLLNDDTFDREIQHRAGPILVDFHASWCAPCKTLARWLDELAEELEGRALVARVDIDDSGDLTNRFGILSVPTLLVFKAGRIADRLVGAAPKEEIRRLVLRHAPGGGERV